MPDTQRSKLLAAEEAVWLQDRALTEVEAQALVAEFNQTHRRDVTLTVVPGEGHLKLLARHAGGELLVPRWALRPLPLLHELAHTLVPAVFPEHGTEFTLAYLDLVRAHASPALETSLRDNLDQAKLILTVTERQKRAKRDAVWYANNAPGTTLKVIVDGPPELLVGEVGARLEDAVIVGEDVITLDRLRYVWRVAAPKIPDN